MSNNNDIIKFGKIRNSCKYCLASHHCLSANLCDEDLTTFNTMTRRRKPLQRGEYLFKGDDKFHSIYIVHSGSVKTFVETRDGEQQITGFYFPGDLLGVDGINRRRHFYSVEALETSSFCEINFKKLEELGKNISLLQQQFHAHISREICREQEFIHLLGRMDSKRRIAFFLMSMSTIMQKQGCSPTHIHLSMTRQDISNYLSLAIETVSRLLTTFQKNKVIDVDRRNIYIKNLNKLQDIIENDHKENIINKSA
ncbi:hypothetical protein AB835_04880 [Candidatus Endobugula sertula]|uniref:Crp/Fnr family transcriptional regulator n=1 Tax=Candidatus Endobugula sertula TaxID=62101 RepID=A0A1D2QRP2_9GAMM|nr:hypothetical protein AB835_04880 [Candidatus Endobugula sertula]